MSWWWRWVVPDRACTGWRTHGGGPTLEQWVDYLYYDVVRPAADTPNPLWDCFVRQLFPGPPTPAFSHDRWTRNEAPYVRGPRDA
jgi:hypothetical protein